jgi:putative peptidoglycan lipid II flippase
MTKSPSSALGRHALAAGLASMLTRLSGLFREVVFAAAFGAGMQTDAYLAAFRVPNLFRDLFAEGSMANAFVPNFARTAEEDGEASAWALANALLGATLAVIGVLTLVMIVFARTWVYAVAAGFDDVPGKVELTATLVRVVAPFLACVSLASIFGGMLNVRGRFFVPAIAPAALNFGVIAGCLIPADVQAQIGLDPIVTVAATSTLGGAVGFLIQMPALRREGFRFRPTLRGHPGLRRLLAFLGPALIGIATIQVGVLIDVQLAAGFGDGPVTWLGYAFRLVQLPMTLFAGAIAVAGLALLSSQVARGEREAARKTLVDAISLTSFLAVPSTVALVFFARPLVAMFFERGAFTPDDTTATALLLQCYAGGTFAFCVYRVVVPSFYAWGDAWTPMLLSIGTLAAKVPLALWWTRPEWFGVQGIPLSHAALLSCEVVILGAALVRHTGGYGWGFWWDQARMGMAGLGMAGVAIGLLPRVDGTWGAMGVLFGSAAVYVALASALGLPQPRQILGRVRAPRGLPPHIEVETNAALQAHLGATVSSIVASTDGVVVQTDRGALRLHAHDGSLVARHEPGSRAPISPTAPLRLIGVLNTTVRPPALHGLFLESGRERWAFRVERGRLVAGEPIGPRVPVR